MTGCPVPRAVPTGFRMFSGRVSRSARSSYATFLPERPRRLPRLPLMDRGPVILPMRSLISAVNACPGRRAQDRLETGVLGNYFGERPDLRLGLVLGSARIAQELPSAVRSVHWLRPLGIQDGQPLARNMRTQNGGPARVTRLGPQLAPFVRFSAADRTRAFPKWRHPIGSRVGASLLRIVRRAAASSRAARTSPRWTLRR
jgi:hypothetical protein